jgi:hypothetical protein
MMRGEGAAGKTSREIAFAAEWRWRATWVLIDFQVLIPGLGVEFYLAAKVSKPGTTGTRLFSDRINASGEGLGLDSSGGDRAGDGAIESACQH